MPNYGINTVSHVSSSHAWLRTDRGWRGDSNTLVPVTLNLALFTANTHFPNGFLPSGIALGVVTADADVYGPYDNAAVDGRTVMRGLLFNAEVVPAGTTTGLIRASMLIHGDVIESLLPANHGVDANGKTDVGLAFTWS